VADHIRTQMGSEQAIRLLREWSYEQRPLTLMIAIAGKFRVFLTGGDLHEVREGIGVFYYVTPDVTNMLFPQDFEQRGMAPSLLRPPRDGWLAQHRKPCFTSPRVPRQGSSSKTFRIATASP
jgi:hypothetical protein